MNLNFHQHYRYVPTLQHQRQFLYTSQTNSPVSTSNNSSYHSSRPMDRQYCQGYTYTRASLIRLKPSEIRKIFRNPDDISRALILRRKEQVRLAVINFRLNKIAITLLKERERLNREIEMFKLELVE